MVKLNVENLIREIEELRQRVRELEELGGDDYDYYVASSNRSIFHHVSCAWAAYFLDSSVLIEFYSHTEAVAAGYKPCKTCRA